MGSDHKYNITEHVTVSIYRNPKNCVSFRSDTPSVQITRCESECSITHSSNALVEFCIQGYQDVHFKLTITKDGVEAVYDVFVNDTSITSI